MTAADLARRLKARANGSGWTASCPAHDDRRASLSIGQGEDGRVLLHCHAGCAAEAVLARLGLSARDLFPAAGGEGSDPRPAVRKILRHQVKDAAGALVAVHVREDLADGTKRMWWERPDGARGLGGMHTPTLPLYGSERLAKLRPDAGVLLVEGEKAAEAVWSMGLPAVGTVTGASGCPGLVALEPLRGRRVIFWPDADKPGREHMDRLARALAAGIALEVRLLTWGEPSSGDDAADFVARGGTRDQLIALVKAAPLWEALVPAPDGDHAQARCVVVTRASEITPVPVTWTWEERIPAGMVSLVAGREGTGKSTMVLERAARLTRGDLEGAHFGTPQSVVLVAAEDSWAHTIVPRLMAAGADLDRVLRVQVKMTDLAAFELSLPEDLRMLAETVEKHQVALVVLDPLISRLSRRLDSHRDAEVRQGLEPLARPADETGAAASSSNRALAGFSTSLPASA